MAHRSDVGDVTGYVVGVDPQEAADVDNEAFVGEGKLLPA